MSEETKSVKEQKEDAVKEFLKSYDMIQQSIEPYLDARRALKKDYADQGVLSKEEISYALKAYRLVKAADDFDEIAEMYELVKQMRGQ